MFRLIDKLLSNYTVFDLLQIMVIQDSHGQLWLTDRGNIIDNLSVLSLPLEWANKT